MAAEQLKEKSYEILIQEIYMGILNSPHTYIEIYYFVFDGWGIGSSCNDKWKFIEKHTWNAI